MQITNNYQPSFRAGRIDKQAMELLSDRLPAGELQPFIDKFIKTHKNGDYKIILGATSIDKPKLDASITYDNKNFRYMEEDALSSIFRHPKSFMKDVNKQIGNDLISIATKGHVKSSFWNKLMWFIL